MWKKIFVAIFNWSNWRNYVLRSWTVVITLVITIHVYYHYILTHEDDWKNLTILFSLCYVVALVNEYAIGTETKPVTVAKILIHQVLPILFFGAVIWAPYFYTNKYSELSALLVYSIIFLQLVGFIYGAFIIVKAAIQGGETIFKK